MSYFSAKDLWNFGLGRSAVIHRLRSRPAEMAAPLPRPAEQAAVGRPGVTKICQRQKMMGTCSFYHFF